MVYKWKALVLNELESERGRIKSGISLRRLEKIEDFKRVSKEVIDL